VQGRGEPGDSRQELTGAVRFNISDLKAKIEQAIAAFKARGDEAVHGGGRASTAPPLYLETKRRQHS
jgi:hypothetical protein